MWHNQGKWVTCMGYSILIFISNTCPSKEAKLWFKSQHNRLFSWLAIISWWRLYWTGDVPDVINLHTCPRFWSSIKTERKGTYADWWHQGHHRPIRARMALINWLLSQSWEFHLGAEVWTFLKALNIMCYLFLPTTLTHNTLPLFNHQLWKIPVVGGHAENLH